MTLIIVFKDQEKYTFYDYKNKVIVHEGFFMLDAIAGYYINR